MPISSVWSGNYANAFDALCLVVNYVLFKRPVPPWTYTLRYPINSFSPSVSSKCGWKV